MVNTCGGMCCSCKVVAQPEHKLGNFPQNLSMLHWNDTHTHTHWLIPLQCPPLPPSSSLPPLNLTHSAHWIIFNPHHLKPRCMPKPPYGHKPPPLSTHTHTHNYTVTRITRAKRAPYSIERHQNKLCVCVCDPRVPSHVCVGPAHFLRRPGRGGNPIRLIDMPSRLHNR